MVRLYRVSPALAMLIAREIALARMVPFWSYNGSMDVSLSIKDVPGRLAVALRRRAAKNHRSIQGELMHILEAALEEPRPFPMAEFLKSLKATGLTSPAESTAMIREDRDSR